MKTWNLAAKQRTLVLSNKQTRDNSSQYTVQTALGWWKKYFSKKQRQANNVGLKE